MSQFAAPPPPPGPKKSTEEQGKEFVNDLGNALIRLSDVLAKHDMTLVSIDLGSWDDGQYFKMQVDREHAFYIEQGIDRRTGEMINQGQVAGVLVRWPTIKQAVPSNFGGPKRFRYK